MTANLLLLGLALVGIANCRHTHDIHDTGHLESDGPLYLDRRLRDQRQESAHHHLYGHRHGDERDWEEDVDHNKNARMFGESRRRRSSPPFDDAQDKLLYQKAADLKAGLGDLDRDLAMTEDDPELKTEFVGVDPFESKNLAISKRDLGDNFGGRYQGPGLGRRDQVYVDQSPGQRLQPVAEDFGGDGRGVGQGYGRGSGLGQGVQTRGFGQGFDNERRTGQGFDDGRGVGQGFDNGRGVGQGFDDGRGVGQGFDDGRGVGQRYDDGRGGIGQRVDGQSGYGARGREQFGQGYDRGSGSNRGFGLDYIPKSRFDFTNDGRPQTGIPVGDGARIRADGFGQRFDRQRRSLRGSRPIDQSMVIDGPGIGQDLEENRDVSPQVMDSGSGIGGGARIDDNAGIGQGLGQGFGRSHHGHHDHDKRRMRHTEDHSLSREHDVTQPDQRQSHGRGHPGHKSVRTERDAHIAEKDHIESHVENHLDLPESERPRIRDDGYGHKYHQMGTTEAHRHERDVVRHRQLRQADDQAGEVHEHQQHKRGGGVGHHEGDGHQHKRDSHHKDDGHDHGHHGGDGHHEGDGHHHRRDVHHENDGHNHGIDGGHHDGDGHQHKRDVHHKGDGHDHSIDGEHHEGDGHQHKRDVHHKGDGHDHQYGMDGKQHDANGHHHSRRDAHNKGDGHDHSGSDGHDHHRRVRRGAVKYGVRRVRLYDERRRKNPFIKV